MRFILKTLAVCFGVLLIAGFVFVQVAQYQDAERAESAAVSTPEPTASSTPSLSSEEVAERDITTKVTLYGNLVCENLADNPSADVAPLIERFIATYGVSGETPEQQLETAHRLLLGSTEKYCTDQTPRVSEAINAE